jgi:uncharacterized protein
MSRRPERGPFTIDLRDIPEEGLSRRYDLAGEWGQNVFAETGDARPHAGLHVSVSMNLSGRDVIVAGTIGGGVDMACSRCLKPIVVALDGEWGMTFVPKSRAAKREVEAEKEVPADEIDLAAYEDEMIDLEPVMREELLLAVPAAPVCAEDCRGLCARCGHDLNQGACACPPEPKNEGWAAALRNVKLS